MKRVPVDFRLLLLGFYIIMLNRQSVRSSTPPNIILVVADDLGYNDVGYHGSKIFTPNLDALARGGVMLENYYVSSSCTPSRSQILTGRYGIHTGQKRNIQPMQPTCLPLDEVTVAQKLKAQNYRTHMVGKWHLGHCRLECTPTYRGFDSFYGILLGAGDHYRHYKREKVENNYYYGYDLWRNNSISRDEGRSGSYSTTLYRNEAIKIVSSHDPKYPLFLYLAFQAPHSPLQVPEEFRRRNNHIIDVKRRYLAGMVTAIDEAVGDLVNNLKSRGLWENTVLVFTTDNGGQILTGGSNWPLRGGKGSLWEGGVRGVGFVNSPLIRRPGRRSRALMHVSDWFPTFVRLSRGDLNGTKPLDGVDQWDSISENAVPQRKEVLLAMLSGTAKQTINTWRLHYQCRQYVPVGLLQCKKKKLFLVPKICSARKKSPKCFTYNRKNWCYRAALRSAKWKLLVGVQKPGNWIPPRGSRMAVKCSTLYENGRRLQLFNLRKDPNETTDLAPTHPRRVAKLMAKLERYRDSAVPEWRKNIDVRGSPHYNGGIWGPWMSSKNTLA